MLHFVWGVDVPGTGPLRMELLEKHWAYMDGYARQLTARGPTLTQDRAEATGSIHIVDLPDLAAARAFAFDEPNHRAGVYDPVLLLRYEDTLGGTMWQHASGRGGDGFLLIGHATPGTRPAAPLPPPPGLLARGELFSHDDGGWLGTAVLVEAAHMDARAVLPGVYDEVEVHPWQMGGRR
ncbi:YciI family protein [Dactylosporangium sp. NPDC005555]|uniref:YciI family protein n=1 Tax=Dactylosporangium sp. NPDC005555 TaxID=3154889 RepID=UPI0033BF3DE6